MTLRRSKVEARVAKAMHQEGRNEVENRNGAA